MTTVFKKEYCGESICDLGRDLIESFDPQFNPKVSDIPQDEYGFQEGSFIVTVEWKPN